MNKAATTATIDEMFEVTARHLPVPSPEEQRTGIVLLRELAATGEPVTIAQLARALGTPNDAAEAFTRDSVLSPFVDLGEGGRIQGFYGISVKPTRHQFTFNGRNLWAWCAPDTLEHPELLGGPTAVESKDPETDQVIRLTVSPARVEAVEPKGVVVSMRRREKWDWDARSALQIMSSICHFQFFFASRESGERWVSNHADTSLLSLDEVFEFVKRFNWHLFGTELARSRANTL
jgi:alkylmercury lyase